MCIIEKEKKRKRQVIHIYFSKVNKEWMCIIQIAKRTRRQGPFHNSFTIRFVLRMQLSIFLSFKYAFVGSSSVRTQQEFSNNYFNIIQLTSGFMHNSQSFENICLRLLFNFTQSYSLHFFLFLFLALCFKHFFCLLYMHAPRN